MGKVSGAIAGSPVEPSLDQGDAEIEPRGVGLRTGFWKDRIFAL